MPNDAVPRNKGAGKSKLTALFTVRRWLREIPCTAAQASTLLVLASFAQPDGTGIHPGIEDMVKLTKLDRSTVIEALGRWRTVGTITRTKAGNRRARQADEYQINLHWLPSKVGPDDFYKHRPEPPMEVHKSDCEGSKVGSEASKVVLDDPSEKTFSEKALPPIKPTPTPPNPPLMRGDTDKLYWWYKSLIAIRLGRRRRLPNLKHLAGATVEMVLDFLAQRGFEARLVQEPVVMPTDRVPSLVPVSLQDLNLIRAFGTKTDEL